MGEFRGTEQIISAKQNQNIKEALTGASSILNIWRENRAIVLKPKQEMAIYSLLQRRDVMEILSTRFGKSMIFTVFAMAKEEISSSKTCMITISPLKRTIDDQISEMLSLCCKAMDLMTEKDAQRNSPYFFAWCSLSYNSNLKIALYVKIQHPANNS